MLQSPARSAAARGHGFDPFLRDLPHAEVLRTPAAIRRAIDALAGREVMVGGADGQLSLARLEEPLALVYEGPCPLVVGQEVAVSDHRGLRYVGFRAVVGAVFCGAHERPTARLFMPRQAVFYPGRRHRRLDGVLGASVLIEYEDAMVPARGLDLSMAGVGLLIDEADGFVMGQDFRVHLKFHDEMVTIPARVRSATVLSQGVRLGVEFLAHDEVLASRFLAALDLA